MARFNVIICVLLQLICIGGQLISNDLERIEDSDNSNGAVLIQNEWHRNDCIVKNCQYGSYYTRRTTNESAISNRRPNQIHLAVLLPSKPAISERSSQILATTLPVIELAIKEVERQQILNGYELIIHYRDTNCSSTIGPMAAFDLHNRQEADVFLGPICDYVLAPVTRYASIWQKPVLTTGGLATAFNIKVSFGVWNVLLA